MYFRSKSNISLQNDPLEVKKISKVKSKQQIAEDMLWLTGKHWQQNIQIRKNFKKIEKSEKIIKD